MRKEVNDLLAAIRSIIGTGKNVKPGFHALLPQVFEFKVKAIKWFLENGSIEIDKFIEEVYPQLEELRNSPKLEVLAENILFALRCNKRVVNALIGSVDFSNPNFTAYSAKLTAISYNQFLASLAFIAPTDETAQKLIDWINSSLYIEMIILTASLIYDENLKIKDKNINQLAFLIADAAQNYSAIATEFGILKPRSHSVSVFKESLDKMYLEEQKYLADLGLNDFARNFE